MNHIQELHDERKRQIEIEGWSPEHDDEHRDGQLLRVAVIYYHYTFRPDDWPLALRSDGAPMSWPWDVKWWKPKVPKRRNLIVAGALCLAELDRIVRRHVKMTQGFVHFGVSNPDRAAYTGHVDQKLMLVLEGLKRIDSK